LLALLATVVATASATTATVTPNPDLQPACGTKVVIVLDESGSIQNTTGAEAAVRAAANAFAGGLADTGSQLAVIEFGSSAKRVFNYTPVTSGAGGTLATKFQPYFNGTASAPADVYDSPSQTGQWTNWEDALQEVKNLNTDSGVAPLVVFITDGDPTATGTTALTPAIVQANAVKAQGSHILAVGVGAALNNATSLGRLNAISGSDTVTNPASLNLETTDVLAVSNFANLPAALHTLVNELCKSSVTLSKLVDNGQGYVPGGSGWTFDGNVSTASGTYSWLTPSAGAAGPRTAATGADSAVTFQWKPSVSTNSTINLTEAPKLGYQIVSVTCQVKSLANPTPVNLPVSLNGTSFSATLGSTDIVTCDVKNKKINPSVTITKAVNKPVVLSGTLVTYTIRVTNTGDVALNTVAVADAIAPSCAKTVGGLAVGAFNEYTCTATIAQDTTNTATVTSKDPQGTAVAPKSASASVDVIAPSLSIMKSVDKPVVLAGTQVTWTVTVANTGDVALTGVAVSDPNAPACDRTIASLAANTVAPAITCTQTIVAGTTNVATVTGKDPLGNTVAPPPASASVDVIAPGLSIAKSVDKPVVLSGTDVTWTVTVTNTGDVALTNVAVSDPNAPACDTVIASLAANTSAPAITCTQNITADTTNTATATGVDPLQNTVGPVSASAAVDVIAPGLSIAKSVDKPVVLSGTQVTWTVTVANTGDVALTGVAVSDPNAPACDTVIESLAANTVAPAITCTQTITAGTTNVATVTGKDPLGNTVAPPPASASVDVIAPGLSITKSVDKPMVLAGTQVTWTIVVENTGDVALANVSVADPTAPGCSTVIETLAAHTAATPITCTATITADTVNTATATGTDPLQNTVGPVTASASVDVIAPGLDITKRVDKAQVAPGEQVTYTVTATNTGDTVLSNVALKDPSVPACDKVIGDLAAGATVTVTCTATITANTTNVATATGTDPLGNPLTKDATAKVDVVVITIAGATQTTLRIDKRGPVNAKAGQVITYRIKITNTGTIDAQNVVMRDKLPGGMALAAKPVGVQLIKGAVVFSVGNLAPGASKTILLKVRIDRTAAGTRNNVATASASNALQVRDNARTRIAKIVARVRIPIVTG
jgi:uncharacterized repeat protein (TIGR01451 family)